MLRRHTQMLVLGTGLIGFCSGTPASADVYQQRAAVAPAFSWTGFYVGANGGYAWSPEQTVNAQESLSLLGAIPPITTFNDNFGSISSSGGFGGLQAGANLQMGIVVLVFEVDGQLADVQGSSRATVADTAGPGTFGTVGTGNKVVAFGTLRPRVGLAWDRSLLYGTAGLAWGRVEHTLAFMDSLGFSAADQTAGMRVGYVVGGGIEQSLGSRLSLKLEYQFIDLGSEHYSAPEVLSGFQTLFAVETSTRTEFHTVHLGVNLKLGP